MSNELATGEGKFYTIFESTQVLKTFNTNNNSTILRDENFAIPNIKIGGTTLTSYQNNDMQYNVDTFFYLYKNPINSLGISDLFQNVQILSNDSTYDLMLQFSSDMKEFKSASFGYTKTFSSTHAIAFDFHHFTPHTYAKNEPYKFKIESLLGNSNLHNCPLDHPFSSATIKYQFSPYPLYIAKVKASLYEDIDKKSKASIGLDLTTTLYTIYQVHTSFSYDSKGFNFGFSLDLIS